MASLNTIPTELQPMILEQTAASGGPKDVLNLLRASEPCRAVYETYWRFILKCCAENILPRYPGIVDDALRAMCCNKDMVLDLWLDLLPKYDPEGEEVSDLETFWVRNARNDVTLKEFEGDKVGALEKVIVLQEEIEGLLDVFFNVLENFDEYAAKHVPEIEFKSRQQRRNFLSTHTGIPVCILETGRSRMREVLWLQEMLRSRTTNLRQSNLLPTSTGLLGLKNAIPFTTATRLSRAALTELSRKQAKERRRYRRYQREKVRAYHAYLRAVQEAYGELRCLGREVQYFLRLMHERPMGKPLVPGLEEMRAEVKAAADGGRWIWKATKWDHDMVEWDEVVHGRPKTCDCGE